MQPGQVSQQNPAGGDEDDDETADMRGSVLVLMIINT